MTDFLEKAVLGSSTDSTEVADVENSKLPIRGKDIESLLKEVIRNVKITNLHLEKISDERFTEEDLED